MYSNGLATVFNVLPGRKYRSILDLVGKKAPDGLAKVGRQPDQGLSFVEQGPPAFV